MTARWGPLGWMTLHSISVCYPENPTGDDKQIVTLFLNHFAETISCPYCKDHFKAMFATYMTLYPRWADSRFNLFVMICRMHNTVNKRLDKPRSQSVKNSLEMLINATTITPPTQFRNKYINYLTNNWNPDNSGDGFTAKHHVREMRRINNEYWNGRETPYSSLQFPEADILETVPEDIRRYALNSTQTFNPTKQYSFRLRGLQR